MVYVRLESLMLIKILVVQSDGGLHLLGMIGYQYLGGRY